MSFDIESVLSDMAAAASDAVKEDAGDIKEYASEIVAQEKQSLKELAEARISGVITDDVFDREIEREKQVIEAQLLTIQ
ncbi:MAG: hypothetical protein MJA83_18280, partial [Gammaproteobacteria bacterium]|nr:hypothetical protein [Gammaproteobacteria bacterium]